MLGEIISPEQSITKTNDFLNLRLKMWTNYCVVAADNLLERKDKPSIEAPSVTCFGLVTCRVKGWQLETGCVVEDNF